jgi:hypothetical protein
MRSFNRWILNKLQYNDLNTQLFLNRNLEGFKKLPQKDVENDGTLLKNIVRTEWVSGDGRCFLYSFVQSIMYQICSMAQHKNYDSNYAINPSPLAARLNELIDIYGVSHDEKRQLKEDMANIIDVSPLIAADGTVEMSWTEHVKHTLTPKMEERWMEFFVKRVLVAYLEQTPSVMARSHPVFEKFVFNDWLEQINITINSFMMNAGGRHVSPESQEEFRKKAEERRKVVSQFDNGIVDITSIFKYYYDDKHPSGSNFISLLTEAIQYDVIVWTFNFIPDFDSSFYEPHPDSEPKNWIEEERYKTFVSNPLDVIHILNSGVVYDKQLGPDEQETITHFYPVIIGATAPMVKQKIMVDILRRQYQSTSSTPSSSYRHPITPSTPSSALSFRSSMRTNTNSQPQQQQKPYPTTPIRARPKSTVI